MKRYSTAPHNYSQRYDTAESKGSQGVEGKGATPISESDVSTCACRPVCNCHNHPQHGLQDPWSSSSLCSCRHLKATWVTVHWVSLAKEYTTFAGVVGPVKAANDMSAAHSPLAITHLPAPPALRCGDTWGRVQAGALSQGLQALRLAPPPMRPAQLPASTCLQGPRHRCSRPAVRWWWRRWWRRRW